MVVSRADPQCSWMLLTLSTIFSTGRIAAVYSIERAHISNTFPAGSGVASHLIFACWESVSSMLAIHNLA